MKFKGNIKYCVKPSQQHKDKHILFIELRARVIPFLKCKIALLETSNKERLYEVLESISVTDSQKLINKKIGEATRSDKLEEKSSLENIVDALNLQIADIDLNFQQFLELI